MKDVMKYILGAIALDIIVYLAIVVILLIWGDTMSNKEINRTMKVLKFMLADLNDAHNNYDVDTMTENRYKEALEEAISDFNTSQDVWFAKLISNKVGWSIHYE